MTSGACRLRLPPAFVEEPGSAGYYPAADRSGFAALDALLFVPGATLDGVARRHLNMLRAAIPDYRETGVARGADSLRVELAGTLEGQEAQGVAYFRQSGPTVCAVTLFLQRRSPIALEDTLQALVASLAVVR